jgi:hypothetical protein
MRCFFISYVSVDYAWACWAARELRHAGSVVYLNGMDFRPAASPAWIEGRVQAGHSVIVILSKAYLACHPIFGKPYEMRRGFSQDGPRNDVLYLAVDSSLLPPHDAKARVCEISGIPESWARMRFEQFLVETGKVWPNAVPPERVAAQDAR